MRKVGGGRGGQVTISLESNHPCPLGERESSKEKTQQNRLVHICAEFRNNLSIFGISSTRDI